MSSSLYILRSPALTIARALFSSEDPKIAIIGVEKGIQAAQSEPGEVLQPGEVLPFAEGQQLTYKELLDVLIETKSVLIL